MFMREIFFKVSTRTGPDHPGAKQQCCVLVCMGISGDFAGEESTCNAGDAGDLGSRLGIFPNQGRSPGGGSSCIVAQRILWTEPGELQSMGLPRVICD